jgi:hypothetical protein
MTARAERKTVVHPSPAPLGDAELAAVAGARRGEILHVVVKYGPGKPYKFHEKLPY